MTTKTEELEARIDALEKAVHGNHYDHFIHEFFVPIDGKYGIGILYLQKAFKKWMEHGGHLNMGIADKNVLVDALEERNIPMTRGVVGGTKASEEDKEFVPDFDVTDKRLLGIGIRVDKIPEATQRGLW